MDKVPFSVYDFFGYLSAGFILLAGVDAAFVGSHQISASPSVIAGILLVVLAYVAGQITANIAGFVLERKLVGDFLGQPTQHLFGVGKHPLERWLPGYYTPLPIETRQRVLEKVRATAGIGTPDEGLFFHCHALMKKEQVVLERLNTFLNLYGFCRNMCVALMSAALMMLLGIIVGSAATGEVGPGWWSAGALLGAVGMFYRYLKFYRQYGLELFTSYAELG
jgi:hypothetical protein